MNTLYRLLAPLAVAALASPLLTAQVTVDTDQTDTTHRVERRVERHIIVIDSAGNRHEIETVAPRDLHLEGLGDLDGMLEGLDASLEGLDASLEGLDVNLQGLDNMDFDFDFDFDFDLDSATMADPAKRAEFQAKMEEMRAKADEMRTKMQQKAEEMRAKMRETMRERNGRVRIERQEVRRRNQRESLNAPTPPDAPVPPAFRESPRFERLREGIATAEERVAKLRTDLERLDANDPNRATLEGDLLSAERDLAAARAGLAAGRAMAFRMEGGNGRAMIVEMNGATVNVDSLLGAVAPMAMAFGGDSAAIARAPRAMAFGRGGAFSVSVNSDSVANGRALSITTTTTRDGEGTERYVVRLRADSSGEGPRVMIRTLKLGAEAANAGDPFTADGPIALKSNVFYIDGDTVRLVDGHDAQMAIRIDHGSSPDGKAHVMILSLRRGGLVEQSDGSETPLSSAPIIAPKSSANAGYALGENIPNPFAGTTSITFTLPEAGHAKLAVYDGSGREVTVLKDEEMMAGTHTVQFDASTLPSGLYLYRLMSGGYSETKTMTVAK